MKVCSVCQRCYEDDVLSCSEVNHDGLTQMRAGDNCEIVPNYRLEFLHESSATGDVYRASNTILKKTYLIKIIPSGLFDETAGKQFLRETQALCAVIHPNVARVYESGTLADGSLYSVTEFLTAQTLRDCLENVGAPSEVTALTITRQAAEGLEAIHAANVLHRSINPENIILTADAENRFLVKLQNIDFGGIGQKVVNSNAEQNLNSLKYFSPEQCAALEVDAQTDVYAMGVVLYEILAGHAPFDATDAGVLINKHINENPPPVSIHNFDIRMLLTHTLTDALQKTARTRLKTANAFVRRIRHIEQLATHSPTPPPVMSYPATMNKAALVFTPQPKIETAVTVENKTVIETPVLTESRAAIETPVLIEDAPIIEQEVLAENEPLIETSQSIENQPVIEDLVLPENQSVVEEMVLAENQPVAESSLSMENQPFMETSTEVESEPIVEHFALSENQPAIENMTAMENQPIAEEAIAVETQSFIESEPAIENELVAENASAVENEPVAEKAEEPEAAAVIYLDLTTNKLPPIESIVENRVPENIKITEITPIFSLKSQVADIHKTSEPALIEWEQPDDVPTITQALGKKKKEIADAQFAPAAPLFSDEDDSAVIDIGEIDAPVNAVSEEFKPRRDYAAERDVFSYDDSGTSWNLPGTRKILTGAAVIAALFVLAVGGTLLSRQLSSDTEQTTAQSAPSDKLLPKSAEPDKIAETDKSVITKSEPLAVNNPSSDADNSDVPALPDFQPREINEKNVVPISQNRNKKQIVQPVKESSESRAQVIQTKPAENKVFDKKGNVKSLTDKKTADKSKLSTKTDIFTRPRIVKNPKF
jgi:serine/threonine protein kinase